MKFLKLKATDTQSLTKLFDADLNWRDSWLPKLLSDKLRIISLENELELSYWGLDSGFYLDF